MLTVILLILEMGLQIGALPGKPPQLKGRIKDVFAERATPDSSSREDKGVRVPWYREVYDDHGRPTELIVFNDDGSVNNTWEYSYASESRLRQREVYDSNRLLKWREVYVYDEKGTLREVQLVAPDGMSNAKYYFKYDNTGRTTEKVRSEINGREYTKESYKYDSNGRICEELMYASPGALDSRVVYSYNTRGEIASKRQYSGNNSRLDERTYRYKYDSHGNWVEQTAFERLPGESGFSAAKVKEVIYRTIEYSDDK